MLKPGDLTVRLLFQRDLPDVLRVERHGPPPRWGREDFRPVFDAPGTDGWVAEAGGQVVGFVVFRASPGRLALLRLGVAPFWRRQGVARAMLAHVHERAAGVVEAAVPEADLAAQLFLRDAGYKAVRVLRRHRGGGDAYLMERRAETASPRAGR
jgi:ribosomal-protein-alanine N-acetyltransferase